MHEFSRERGFTMLELAVALLIVGLLSVIAVVSLSEHQSRKAKRQAIHHMQEVAAWLHQQRPQYGSFAAILPPGWVSQEANMPYRISLATGPVAASDPAAQFPALSADTFTLQAVPLQEDGCGALLLDQSGRRGVTGAGAKVAKCWE